MLSKKRGGLCRCKSTKFFLHRQTFITKSLLLLSSPFVPQPCRARPCPPGFMPPDAAPAPDARRAKKPPSHSGWWGMLRLRRAKRRIERTEKQDTKDWRRTYQTGRRFYSLPYTIEAGLCAVACLQCHARPSAATVLIVKGHAVAIMLSFSYLEIAG